MRKLINIGMVAAMALMVSCHTRKKVEDLHVKSTSYITSSYDSTKTVTDHKLVHIDSSRTEKSDSSATSSRDVYDFTFYLKGKPFDITPDSAGTGERDRIDGMISQALANSDSAKVHVERVRNHRQGSKTIQQQAVKDTGNVHSEHKAASGKVAEQKTLDKTEHTEIKTTPNNAWIGWLIALLALLFISLYIHHKLFP